MHPTTASRRPACGVKEVVERTEKAIRASEKAVGGDEGTCGTSGSLTPGSLASVIDTLVSRTGLGGRSVAVDIGASIGKLVVQVSAQVKVAAAVGIEICDKKIDKAKTVLQLACTELKDLQGREQDFRLISGSAAQVGALSPPPTHFFAFWQGFNPRDKMTVANLVMRHSSRRAIVVVQEYKQRDITLEMELYGFRGLRLVDTIKVAMSGSSSPKHAYVFIVEDWSATGAGSLDDLSEEGKPKWWFTEWSNMVKQQRKFEQEEAWGAALAAGENPGLSNVEKFGARLAYRAPSVLAEIATELEYQPIPFAPPGFEINAHGSVRRVGTHEPLWAYPMSADGHWYVQFSTGGSRKQVMAVRTLVAVVFIVGALDELQLDEKGRQKRGGSAPRVFHQDGVKANNRATNLVLRSPGVEEEQEEREGNGEATNAAHGGAGQQDPGSGGNGERGASKRDSSPQAVRPSTRRRRSS